MSSTTLQFAPGEQNVTEVQLSTSAALFWIKTVIGASSTRVVTRVPNTIAGVIPIGYHDAAYPLSNIASVGVNSRFSMGRLVGGLIALIVGIALISSSAVAAFIVIVLALAALTNVMKAELRVQNNGGGVTRIDVSFLQKAKLEQFREELNQRVFADHGRLRHNEHMSVQNQQLYTQQQQLNAQIMAQSAMLQGLAQPGQAAPSAPLVEPTGDGAPGSR